MSSLTASKGPMELVQLVHEITSTGRAIDPTAARAIQTHEKEVVGAIGVRLDEFLGPRFEEYLDQRRIAARTDRLLSELTQFDLGQRSYTTAEIIDLRLRITDHTDVDPELKAIMSRSPAWSSLLKAAETGPSCEISFKLPVTEGFEALALHGSELASVQQVVKAISSQMAPGTELLIRGGSAEEALGWFMRDGYGDPRVKESAYTRRVGAEVPAFDITSAARVRDGGAALAACIGDAARYARSGAIYQNAARLLREQEGIIEPTAEDVRRYPLEATDLDLSKGVLMLFSAPSAACHATFHRRDPQWNKGSYDHVATIDDGNRTLVALIPVPQYKKPQLPGAFALLTTDQMKALAPEAKQAIFSAAFQRMDRAGFEESLTQAITPSQRRVA